MTVVDYKPSYVSARSNADFPQKQSKNNGITLGRFSMPQKFSVADNSSDFSLGRNVYSRSINNGSDLVSLKIAYNKISGRKTAKGIDIQSSDQHIERLKNIAIGKGSTTTNSNDERSFKTQYNANRNTVNTALRKARNNGYVPPKKAAHRFG